MKPSASHTRLKRKAKNSSRLATPSAKPKQRKFTSKTDTDSRSKVELAPPIHQGPELVIIPSGATPGAPLARFAGSQPVYWPPEIETRHLWLSAEHLFQAARFARGTAADPASENITRARPLRVRVRHRKTAFGAHVLAERHAALGREDWAKCAFDVLRWALELRFYWNHHRPFGRALLATSQRPLVLVTKTDPFWGAVELRPGVYQGHNHYGRILAEVRANAPAILAGDLSHPSGFLDPLAA